MYHFTIWEVSNETIIRRSSGDKHTAPVTLVPPPNGTTATLYLVAKAIKSTT